MRAEIATFTASLLINAAILAGFDRAVSHYETSLLAEREERETQEKIDNLQVEFIEAPPKTTARSPKEAKKFSDRDSVAQDLTQEKENAAAGALPKIETQGPADQLAQRRVEPSQAPAAASAPSPPQMQRPPEPQTLDAEAPDALPDPSRILAQMTPSPLSVPAEGASGSSGLHRINTQAVSRARSHGAQVYGVTSFEATGSGMGQYMKNMKERIWLAWFPYLAFKYPADFRAADAVVEFTLDADGQMRQVRVIASEGSTLFAAFCIESVQRAAPFGPLPPEILALIDGDELEVKFAFHFW